jgi:DNA-binding transcriptional ArsR family regulator
MQETANNNGKFAAFNQVIRNPTISPGAKAVFALLFTYTNGSGICWPGVERLAQELGKSRRWVMYHLSELTRVGAIERVRRGKTLTNIYRLCGDVQNTAPVMCNILHSDVQNSVSQNASPPYSHAASEGRNIPEEHTSIEHTSIIPCDKSQGRRKKKTSPKNETDNRVNPVLKAFHDEYVKHFGVKPTETVLNFGRDGRRIKKLPADYTTEMLMELIPRFFQAPGYIAKGYDFGVFIAAIPRLMKNETEGKRYDRKHSKPPAGVSKDFSSWL